MPEWLLVLVLNGCLWVGQTLPAATPPEPLFLDKPLSVWLLELRSGQASQRRAAVYAVSKLKLAQHYNDVLPLLADADPEVRMAVADALGAQGPLLPTEPVHALAKRFTVESRPEVQRSILSALARSEKRLQAIVPVMQAGLQHAEASVRLEAVALFGQWGTAAPEELLPSVVKLAKDANAEVRQAVLQALGQLGPLARDALICLQEGLTDADLRVREQALASLGQLGPLADRSTPELRRFLQQPDHTASEKRLAWLTLTRLGPVAAFQVHGEWQQGLLVPDPVVRAEVARAILPLLRQGQGWCLVPACCRSLHDASIVVRYRAGWGLMYLLQHEVKQLHQCMRSLGSARQPSRFPRG